MGEDNRAVSERGIQWLLFIDRVLAHIESYTVPQYGDYPNDQVESWTAKDCVRQIGKYVARFNSNSRGENERLKDLVKIAHYAQLAYDKEIGKSIPDSK